MTVHSFKILELIVHNMESELYLEILLYMGIRWLPILHVILLEESLYSPS